MAILLLDLETTTADRHTASIVELAAAWMDGPDDPLDQCWQMQCRPREDAVIDPASVEFNGSADWIHAGWMPREGFMIHSLSAWIRSTRPEVQALDHRKGQGIIMAGWNVGLFDWLVLQNAWQASASADPFPFSFRTLDLHAVALADLMRRGISVPSTGLTSSFVCHCYRIPAEPRPHRAMGGVRFEAALYHALLPPS